MKSGNVSGTKPHNLHGHCLTETLNLAPDNLIGIYSLSRGQHCFIFYSVKDG